MSSAESFNPEDIRIQLVCVGLAVGKMIEEGRVQCANPGDQEAMDWVEKLSHLTTEAVKIIDSMPDDAIH